MQQLKLYLKPHQERYLISICGKPPFLSAKFNLAPLVFSLLRWEEFSAPLPETKVYVPDWVLKDSGGKVNIGERGNKVIGDYLDSLLDIDLFQFLAPYHKNSSLYLKDGIYLFIDAHNLPGDMRTYEMLKKRDYRMRKKNYSNNPAIFFDDLSSYCPKPSLSVSISH
ncbi:MAG: hypothetical protein WCX31_04630 [Salinivirgaceae bacterium]|jgi:hypothetical protein